MPARQHVKGSGSERPEGPVPRLQGVRALLVLTGVKWALVPPEGSVPQSDKMSAPHPQGAETGRVPAGRRGQGKCLGEKLPLDGVRRQGMPGSQDWCAQRGMGERVPRASLPPAPPPHDGYTLSFLVWGCPETRARTPPMPMPQKSEWRPSGRHAALWESACPGFGSTASWLCDLRRMSPHLSEPRIPHPEGLQ